MLPQPCTADPALAWWERKRTGRLNGTARASRDVIQKIRLDSKAPVVALVSSHQLVEMISSYATWIPSLPSLDKWVMV